MTKKNIAFVTGTRADYGKIKSLLKILKNSDKFNVEIIVTGMHLLPSYGATVGEILDDDLGKIHLLPNQISEQAMEISLARTIDVISQFLSSTNVDLLIVHGDRIEALAGAIVGVLRNVPVAHIEGGEVSGTVDGLIRHSISKLAHLHFVSNESAQNRLLQLGESKETIFNIGSPDIDVMFSEELPSFSEMKKRYEIQFDRYAIVIFHPVTTELATIREQAIKLCEALKKSGDDYIVIKPNNDLGSDLIQDILKAELKSSKFKHLPSMRFEYFLTLMKNCNFMIGNSSAGVRETSYYGVPSINVGSRQRNRSSNRLILNVISETNELLRAISQAKNMQREPIFPYGMGNSDSLFKDVLENQISWPIGIEKVFVDLERTNV
jgi:UDP-N-acetylglucosamine 2-epimerase (hydrolysing)